LGRLFDRIVYAKLTVIVSHYINIYIKSFIIDNIHSDIQVLRPRFSGK
jgi:hypothetical protein